MRYAGFALAAAGAAALSLSAPAHARDQIQVVGSSTVFPYSQAVAERFASKTGRPAPVVEATGTGGGMQIFCRGVGEQTPDVSGASRAMKRSEWEQCQKNGVTEITEIMLGYDGLSMAVSRKGKPLDVTKAQLFQALAAEVPVNGEIKPNPYRKWSDIDPSLPDIPITVYGPPPTSGTRDAWVELVMVEGCKEFDAIKVLPEERQEEVCQRMRTDKHFIEAGENDNLIVQRLEADPNAYGIFGYSFLYENEDQLQPVKIGGVEPSFEAIESGDYPVSRPLYVYVKNAHRAMIPGLAEFIKEYTSEEALGEEGYLADRGLIPLSEEQVEQLRANALTGTGMKAPES